MTLDRHARLPQHGAGMCTDGACIELHFMNERYIKGRVRPPQMMLLMKAGEAGHEPVHMHVSAIL